MLKFAFLFIFFPVYSFCQHNIVLMEHVVFYDGYAPLSKEPTPTGVLRLKNDINGIKLNESVLKNIGENLNLHVTISARCDNYDRIGNVFLAFVPKNQNSYNTDSVLKIELGRFITPFMQKNRDPKSVSYTFNLNHLAFLFQDTKFRAKYDYWLELAVFGVPYAAQKEVEGCSERNDTFEGKVEISYTESKKVAVQNFIPVATTYLINNYETNTTDELGKTKKTFTFSIKKPINDATIYLISSNHGANEGGEEYVRREHLIFVDDSLRYSYTPGGKSCEPYRMFNTQGNGIYEREPKTEEDWTSWNNWCPGDVIPIREIHLGTLKAGEHTITITVPDAQFVDKNGYFPISMYVISSSKSKKQRAKKK